MTTVYKKYKINYGVIYLKRTFVQKIRGVKNCNRGGKKLQQGG